MWASGAGAALALVHQRPEHQRDIPCADAAADHDRPVTSRAAAMAAASSIVGSGETE